MRFRSQIYGKEAEARLVVIHLTPAEWAWLDKTSSYRSMRRLVSALLSDLIRDDVAEEKKTAA